MTADEFSRWDAAYVLGALSHSDREKFENHLAGCDSCRAAVAELVMMPGLLAAVPADIAAADHPEPSTGWSDVLAARRRQKRSSRIRDVLVAAAAILVIAVPLGVLLVQEPDAGPAAALDTSMQPLRAVVPTAIVASAAVYPHPWGTTVALDCRYDSTATDRYGSQTEDYALTITDAAGRVEQLATWTGMPGTTVTPTATTSVTAGSIDSIDIRAVDSGEVLQTLTLG